MGRHHKSLALCALIVLLAGAVGWFASAWSVGAGDPSGARDVAGPEAPALARVEAPVRAAEPIATSSREDASELVEDEDEEEEAEAERVAKRSAGELSEPTLKGRTVDPLGKPIAGARVLLPRDTGVAGVPLDAWIHRAVVREVLTDAQGRFGPLTLDPGKQRIAVRAAGHGPWDATLDPLALGEARDLGDIRLPRSDLVAGKVVDAQGEPVVGAAIFRADAAGGQPRWRRGAAALAPLWETGEDGRFELASLPPGGATVLVRHPDHPDAEFEAVRRDGQGELRWTLAAGARITGTVPGLRPEEAVILEVLAVPYAAHWSWKGLHSSRGPLLCLRDLRSAPVTAEGTFELRGLAPDGSYQLRVFESARLEAQVDEPDAWSPWRLARAGDEHVALEYGPSARLEFTVIDASTGNPIEALEVAIDGEACRDAAGKPRRRFPGGRVELTGLRRWTPQEGSTSDHDGTLHLSVTATGFDPLSVDRIAIEPSQVVSLGVLSLVPCPTFLVRVEEVSSHRPIGGAALWLVGPGWPSFTFFGDPKRTRRDGRARLTSAGFPARLTVLREGYLDAEVQIPALPPPDEPWIVPMSMGGTLIATVREFLGEPVAAAQVRLEQLGVPEIEALKRTLDSDVLGRAAFTGLPTGIYAVFARRPDGIGGLVGPARLEVSSPSARVVEGHTSELEVRVPPLSSLALRLRAGREPVDHAIVSFAPVPANPFYSTQELRSFPEARAFRADESGNVPPIALAPGTYAVWIEHRGMQLRTRRRVDVPEHPIEVEIDIADTHLAGRVVDPRGSSTEGLEVRLLPYGRRGWWGSWVRIGDPLVVPPEIDEPVAVAVTDEAGEFRFDVVPPDLLLRLEVRSDGWTGVEEGMRCLPRDRDRKWHLRLAAPGSIELQLDTLAPPPTLSLGVQLFQQGPLDPEPIGLLLDDESSGTVAGLEPGSYRMCPLYVDRYGRIVEQGPMHSVTVKSGEVAKARWSW